MNPTKTNRRKLARAVNSDMRRYVNQLEPNIEHYARERGRNIANVRLNTLLSARANLSALIRLEQQS